jgi:hypothetical protein
MSGVASVEPSSTTMISSRSAGYSCASALSTDSATNRS